MAVGAPALAVSGRVARVPAPEPGPFQATELVTVPVLQRTATSAFARVLDAQWALRCARDTG